MHDLIASQEVAQKALKEANKNNLKKITKIVIGLGVLKEHGEIVSEENMRFHLSYLLKGTIAEKTKLEFKKIKSPNIILKEIEGE